MKQRKRMEVARWPFDPFGDVPQLPGYTVSVQMPDDGMVMVVVYATGWRRKLLRRLRGKK